MNITCSRCRMNLPEDRFSLNKGKSTGRNTYCRSCFKIYYQQNRSKWDEAYLRHKDKRIANQKDWQARNPDLQRKYRRLSEARRRAAKRGAAGYITQEKLDARAEFYGHLCYLCRVNPFEVMDHVIPLSRGGTNWPANQRPACASCNARKATKTLAEFAGWLS